MFSSSLTLYALTIKAIYQRIKCDLARELVVAVCAGVLMATFFYIFNDFINIEVKKISLGMRENFAQAAAYGFLIVATLVCLKQVKLGRRSSDGISNWARRLGEAPPTIGKFQLIRLVGTLTFYFVAAWFIALRWFVSWDIAHILTVQAVCFAIVLAGQCLPESGNKSQIPRPIKLGSKLNRIQTMFYWRFQQVLRRSRSSQLSLLAANLFAILVLLLALIQAPFFVIVFASFVAGTFASFTIAYSLQEDLTHAWLERSFGSSHEEFLATYERLGWFIGSVSGLTIAMFYLVSGLVSGSVMDSSFASQVLKLFVIGSLSTWIMPYLMLQIDPRKPFIQMILVAMIGLFLATAIFANWIGIVLIYFLRYYGFQMQQGRFYRA